ARLVRRHRGHRDRRPGGPGATPPLLRRARGRGAHPPGGFHAPPQPVLHRPRAAHVGLSAGPAGGRGPGMTGPSALLGTPAPLGRLWFYANYHCNLACQYCLTESAPTSARRMLAAERMVRAARQAAEIGFSALGVT